MFQDVSFMGFMRQSRSRIDEINRWSEYDYNRVLGRLVSSLDSFHEMYIAWY